MQGFVFTVHFFKLEFLMDLNHKYSNYFKQSLTLHTTRLIVIFELIYTINQYFESC